MKMTNKTDYYKEFLKSAECAQYFYDCVSTLNSDDKLENLIKLTPNLISNNLKDLSKKHTQQTDFVNEYELRYLSMLVDSLDVFMRKFILDFFKRHPASIPASLKISLTDSSIYNKKKIDDIKPILWESLFKTLRWLDWDSLLKAVKKLPKLHDYISLEQSDIEYVRKAKKIRNLVVHSNAVIDKDFKKQFGDNSLIVGDTYKFKRGQFVKMIVSIESFASRLNSSAPRNRDAVVRKAMLDTLSKLSIGDSIIL
jgi:hypothetical protein